MIHPSVRIEGHATIDPTVEIGEGCVIMEGAYLPAGVSLGERVLVGPGVIFTNADEPRAGEAVLVPIKTEVGSDATLGAGAVILPGAHIGAGSIVGAGSVVTKPVSEYVVAAGNPAREIRKR